MANVKQIRAGVNTVMNRLAVLANERLTKTYVFGEGVNRVLGVQSVSEKSVTVVVDRVVTKQYKFNLLEELESEYALRAFLENHDINILHSILMNIEPKYEPLKKDIERALAHANEVNPIQYLREKYSSDTEESDDDDYIDDTDTEVKTVIDLVEVPNKYIENPETAYREVCADESIQQNRNSYLMDMEERRFRGLPEISFKEWAEKQHLPHCVRHEAKYLDTGEIISLSGDDCGECIGYNW